MAKPITDKAEVSIDFPDKFYMGSFSRESRFGVTADAGGVHLWLERTGENRRKVSFHVHYHLLTGILEAMADAIRSGEPIDDTFRNDLAVAAGRLGTAFAEQPPTNRT